MKQFEEIIDSPNDIVNLVCKNMPKIVGIDGIDGVGKTSLAKKLEKVGYLRISLDDYLIKKSGGYFNYLKFDGIKSFFKNNVSNFIVIEGVLLLKILKNIGVKVDYLIYITDSIWLFDWSKHFNGRYSNMKLKEIIKYTESQVNKLNSVISPKSKKYNLCGLREELYKYSYKYKPWDLADVILKKLNLIKNNDTI